MHDGPVLRHGADLTTARAVTLLVHGRNRTPDEMIALAEKIAPPAMAFVAPTADNASWYPQSFLAPLEQNQPQLDGALARLDALVAELEASGFGRERIALVGFSQGACLLCEYVLRRPTRWGALVSLTGGAIGPPETELRASGQLDGTPMYFGIAAEDAWVPLSRSRATATLFTDLGAEIHFRIREGAEHVISDDDIAATRQLLARV